MLFSKNIHIQSLMRFIGKTFRDKTIFALFLSLLNPIRWEEKNQDKLYIYNLYIFIYFIYVYLIYIYRVCLIVIARLFFYI